jgi:hypothetical protein
MTGQNVIRLSKHRGRRLGEDLLFGCVATFGGACWYTTRNVTHLVLREAVKGAPQIALTKSGDRWTTGAGDAGAD